MQVQEEPIMGSKHIFKGKRTKRQRTMSSLALTMATSSCSSGAEGGDDDAGGVYVDLSHFSSGFERFTVSHSDSGDEVAQSSVEEEEDMANCLILLAQGSSQKPSSQRPTVMNRSVVDVYRCKTCDRCFPSFQALGGHRASHKKPKVIPTEEKKPANLLIAKHESTVGLINLQDDTSTTLSLQIPGRELCISSNNNKSRVHECSICGAEFSSGQALGGHMRRHRPLPTVTSSGSTNEDSQELKKQRTVLSLDLNLPAAESEAADCRELKYPFTPKQEAMAFSASPLVDCHY